MSLTVCRGGRVFPHPRPLSPDGARGIECLPGAHFPAQRGFSLVEIMVALVIGLLGIIVMMQTFALFEAQKRTTTGGDDAISSGAIVLHDLSRDIQHAGWGTSSSIVLGCFMTDVTTDSSLFKGGAAIPLAPVTINPLKMGSTTELLIPPGDANTDTLLVVSGNTNGNVDSELIQLDSGAEYRIQSAGGVAMAEYVAIGPKERVKSGDCTVSATRVSQQPNVLSGGGSRLKVESAISNVVDDMHLVQLGKNPAIRAYAIRKGALTVCDWRVKDCSKSASDSTVWVPLADNIVSLRAQYGQDTTGKNGDNDGAMDGVVDQWDQSIPAIVSGKLEKNGPACVYMRMPTVRLVLVARSSQPEKRKQLGSTEEPITQEAPGWLGSACPESNTECKKLNPTGANISLAGTDVGSSDWPSWQDFRYKVFQTIIPLRNIVQDSEC